MSGTYLEPQSVDEVLETLAEHGAGARVVAGGTDLVVRARGTKTPLPDALVAVHRLSELGGIQESDETVSIGALVSYQQMEDSELLRDRYTALVDAAKLVGSPATRHVGTIGGNLCNASPAMETGSPLLVFDASVELRSSTDSRRVAIADFLEGPGRSAAKPDELLTEVVIPALPENAGSAYLRLEYRQAMEIAIVGAAAMVVLGGDGTIREARIALTAVAPTCVRAPEAEAELAGNAPTAELLAEAGASAANVVAPIDDVRASADYRRKMVPVIVERALGLAIDRAGGGD